MSNDVRQEPQKKILPKIIVSSSHGLNYLEKGAFMQKDLHGSEEIPNNQIPESTKKIINLINHQTVQMCCVYF